jgi:predicted nucleic acid-binding protein
MNYLLDTCLISEMVAKQPNQQVVDWLDAQVPETFYISMITIGEIAKGISKMTASKRKESLMIWLYQNLPDRFKHRILKDFVGTGVVIINLW